MRKFLLILFFSSFLLSAHKLFPFDVVSIWRHPEIAEKNSIFIGMGVPIAVRNPEFNLLPLFFSFDYMLPIYPPITTGFFFFTPMPNFKDFGLRFAYHLNFFDPLLDIYFLYSFNCGFILKDFLAKYNDKPPPTRIGDYRIGFRRFFGSWFGVSVETGFKFESIFILLSVKIN